MRTWRARRTWLGRGALAAVVLTMVAQAGVGGAAASTRVTDRYFGMHAPGLASGLPERAAGCYQPHARTACTGRASKLLEAFSTSALSTRWSDQAHAHGAQPLLVLGFTPAFASTKPHAPIVAGSVPKMSAWRSYVHSGGRPVQDQARLPDLAGGQRVVELAGHAATARPVWWSRRPRSFMRRRREHSWCLPPWCCGSPTSSTSSPGSSPPRSAVCRSVVTWMPSASMPIRSSTGRLRTPQP